MAKKTEIAKVGELLVLIGAILSLIFGILILLNYQIFMIDIFNLGSLIADFLIRLVVGIVLIILSLVTLATSGVIKFPYKLEKNWIMLLILGIVLLVLGGSIGAILVIIGAILMIF